jgi:hypothetical protein
VLVEQPQVEQEPQEQAQQQAVLVGPRGWRASSRG